MTDMSIETTTPQRIERMSESELRALKERMMQSIRDDRSQMQPLMGRIARINAYIRASRHGRARRS